MAMHVFSDYTGDRLALMKAKRERALGASSMPSSEEAALRAGRDGEVAVLERLAAQCEEPFSLVTGYHSWRGEIDVLLITPTMVVAIEVKTLNADIAIDGDLWLRRRQGVAGGRQEEWYAVEDEGGRSPSQQLNQAADYLQGRLARNGVDVPVRRWVVLAHPKCQVVRSSDVSVDAVVLVADLDIHSLSGSSHASPPVPVNRVTTLARIDHSQHEQRRAIGQADAQSIDKPPVTIWPDTRRVKTLVDVAREATAKGEGSSAWERLRAIVRDDLLARARPQDVPALLNELWHEPALRRSVSGLAEEAVHLFEEDDRCLVALTIPVMVRLRSYLNGEFVLDTVNPDAIKWIENLCRTYHRLRRVAFDARLYSPEAVRGILPREMRRYTLDVAERGAAADAPAEACRLVAASPEAAWETVHVLGVAEFERADVPRARRLSRLSTPPPYVPHPLGAFDISGLQCRIPGVLHETHSLGVCVLGPGLSLAEEELRRLSTGVQAARPEWTFMLPLRYAL